MIASILILFTALFNLGDSTATDTPTVSWMHAQQVHDDVLTYQKLDTTLESFRFINPILGKTPSLYLGNYGTSTQALRFNEPSLIGQVLHAADPFAPYLIHSEDVRYYQARKHYSEIFYEQGAKKEQVFRVSHTQNISPNLNVGLNLNKAGSEGYYTRQKSTITSYDFFLWYHTKNQRYNLFANYIGNKLKVQENGGVNDLIYESGESKKNIPVNYSSAERRYRDRGFDIQQSWNYGSYSQLMDTAGVADSTKAKALTNTRFQARGQFSHNFSYQKKYTLFENPLPSYFFIDSITLDSTSISTISNAIEWTTMGFKNALSGTRKVKYTLGLIHELTDYKQVPFSILNVGAIEHQFNNLIAEANVEGALGKKASFGLNVRQNIYGYNKNDHAYNGYFYIPFNHKNDFVGVSFASLRQAPDFRMQHFSSNAYVWDNAFTATDYQSASLGLYITHLGIKATATGYSIKGYLYYDTNGLPAQFDGNVGLGIFSIQKNFKWRHWNWQNKFIFQVADNDLLRLPQAILQPSLFYENKVFKKSTLMRIAMDINYMSSYYASAYVPETGVFRVQNDKLLGNYPLLDLSVSMLVKRARVFFKLAHANEGLMQDRAYSALHYPYPGRAFQFGISWRFFD